MEKMASHANTLEHLAHAYVDENDSADWRAGLPVLDGERVRAPA